MENNETGFRNTFFSEVFNILEKFLSISHYDDNEEIESDYDDKYQDIYIDDNDYSNYKDIIKREVSNEFSKKKQTMRNIPRRSNRKTKTPIRYGYDE